MDNLWEKFQEKYSSAPEAIKMIIDSDRIPKCIDDVYSSLQISAESRKELIRSLAYKTLGLISEKDIVSHIANQSALDLEKATNIYHSLQDCLQIDTVTAPSLINEIAETEAVISTIPTVRTMGSDSHLPPQSHSEAVYSSTQSAILQEGINSARPQ